MQCGRKRRACANGRRLCQAAATLGTPPLPLQILLTGPGAAGPGRVSDMREVSTWPERT
nr:MAG TPA: hypothetical protein [Caudoviricetes sp.]